MRPVQLVRLADCPPLPWRNAGGLTRELLRWPAASGAEGWVLRISVAEIGRDGPFSPFPGIERWFAVLEGAGVQLEVPRGAQFLAPGDSPLQFAGEAAPGCRLVGGPTLDLNLMQRRGQGHARMHRVRAGSGIEGPTSWRGVYAHGPLPLALGDEPHVVEAGTLLWSDDDQAPPWRAIETGLGYWMELRA